MEESNPSVDRKLQIARALAAKAFARHEEEISTENSTDNSPGQHIIRGPGTAEIIRNPDYRDVYSMSIERKFVTRYNLNRIVPEMTKMSEYSTVSVRSLVRTLRECLKVIIAYLNIYCIARSNKLLSDVIFRLRSEYRDQSRLGSHSARLFG